MMSLIRLFLAEADVRRVERRLKDWRRFRTGLRRDIERNQPIVLFAALSVITLAAYGMFVYGAFDRITNVAVQGVDDFVTESGFRVKTVSMTGHDMTDPSLIMQGLGVERGEPLFHFDADSARQRLESISWVKSASVTRLWPDELFVELKEREPFAIWQTGGTFYLIDKDGVRLSTLSAENIGGFTGLPHVVGEGADKHAAALFEHLETVPALRSRLHAASRVGNRRWNLRLDNGIDVRLPDTDIEGALRVISRLDEEYRLLARKIAVIDLRLADVLIIRPEKTRVTRPEPHWRGEESIAVIDREV